MIVKPSVSFLTADSDALLVTDTGSILKGMTGNLKLPHTFTHAGAGDHGVG
jgi:hypothetical protein